MLVPEDFGIVALATAYIAIVEGLTALPMAQALIRFRDADRSLYDTAWTLSVLRGVAIALLILASAAPVAGLMDEPRLITVILVLALRPLLEGLINPRFIDFDKDLDFSRPMMVRVGTKAVAVASAWASSASALSRFPIAAYAVASARRAEMAPAVLPVAS